MLFVIIGHDSDRARELRPIHRAEHLAGLKKLLDAGKLVIAGPFTDKSGSLVIVDTGSREEADRIAAADPYVREGIFASYEVRPYLQVYPEPQQSG